MTIAADAMHVGVSLRAVPSVKVDAAVAGWLRCEPSTAFLKEYVVAGVKELAIRRKAGKSDREPLTTVGVKHSLRVHDCQAVEGSDFKWCLVDAKGTKGWASFRYFKPGKPHCS